MIKVMFVVVIGLMTGRLSATELETNDILVPSKFVSCYDGDTCTFELDPTLPKVFHKMSVRIKGIDTAEMKGGSASDKQCALKAKDHNNKVLSSATSIELVNCEGDKYFRLLCDVKADGVDIATSLIDKGFAVAYDGGTKSTGSKCKS